MKNYNIDTDIEFNVNKSIFNDFIILIYSYYKTLNEFFGEKTKEYKLDKCERLKYIYKNIEFQINNKFIILCEIQTNKFFNIKGLIFLEKKKNKDNSNDI